jgi:hypothetical protein
MATKLYFRNIAVDYSGNFPAPSVLMYNPGIIQQGASDIGNWKMLTNIGSSQASKAWPSTATTSQQYMHIRRFISPPLNGAQTVGGGTLTFNCAGEESNTNMNHWWNNIHIVVWDPISGTVRGTVKNGSTSSMGGSEPTSQSSEQVDHWTTSTSAVSAKDGDHIIIEIGSVYTQGMATSYTGTFYFDGTTENTTENASVSNHASFVSFFETLTFKQPFNKKGEFFKIMD